MFRRQSPRELVAVPPSLEVEVEEERRTLNPVTALQRARERRKSGEDEHLMQLTGAVVTKLCAGIAEKGMVSLFRHKTTGALLTETYRAEFSSTKIPYLSVSVWRSHEKEHKLALTMIEHRKDVGYRALSIERDDDVPEGEFKLRFSVDGTDEGQPEVWDKSQCKVITYKEKARFLQDILATEVDVAQTEQLFGAPYTPGGMRPHSDQFRPPEEHSEYFNFSGYWVRDVIDQLPALPGVTSHQIIEA